MLMVGCQKEDIITPNDNANYPADGVVRIATNVNALESRATTDKNLYAGSNLSLTVDYGSGDKYTKPNIEWTKDESNAWSTTNQMLWKDATTAAKVYAYAPYVASQTNLTAISFSAQLDQSIGLSASDLVGYVNKGFVPGSSLTTKNAIPIKFDHKMSQLGIKFTFGDEFGATAPTVASVYVSAKVGVAYNVITATATAAGDVVSITPNKTDNTSYSAIIAPQTVSGASMVEILLENGDEYMYVVPVGGHTFAQGTAYAINLRIGKDVVTATEVTVSEWGSGTSQDFGGDTEVTTPPFTSTLPTDQNIVMDYAQLTGLTTNVRGSFSVVYRYNDSVLFDGLADGSTWLTEVSPFEFGGLNYLRLTYQPFKATINADDSFTGHEDKKITIDGIEYTIKYDNGYITDGVMTTIGNFNSHDGVPVTRNGWAPNGFHLARRGDRNDPFTSNVPAGSDVKGAWSTREINTNDPNMTSNKFNMGRIQTNLVLNDENVEQRYPAAEYCRDMGADYYLLSVSEYKWMLNAVVYLGKSYSFGIQSYWSATEESTNHSWWANFSGNDVVLNRKGNGHMFRCVRDL